SCFNCFELFGAAPEFDAGGGALRTGRGECHFAAGNLVVRNLARGDLNAFSLGIRIQKFLCEKAAEGFEIAAGKVQGLTLDEILHRVSRDQVGVVAGYIGRPESIAVEKHHNAGAEDRALIWRTMCIAVQAVNDHVAFTVVVPFCAAGETLHKTHRETALRRCMQRLYVTASCSRNKAMR